MDGQRGKPENKGRNAWEAPEVRRLEAGLAENNNVTTRDGGGTPGTNLS